MRGWENGINSKIKAMITTGNHKILQRAVLNCLISLINTTSPQSLRQSELCVNLPTYIWGSRESLGIVIFSRKRFNNTFTYAYVADFRCKEWSRKYLYRLALASYVVFSSHIFKNSQVTENHRCRRQLKFTFLLLH